MKPSLVHFFNKLVVCPASSSSPGFNHWGLLWCFWGMAHPLWVWLRSGRFVVETQLPLHCLFWKSGFLALFEGQCRRRTIKQEDYLGDVLLIWIFWTCFLSEREGTSGFAHFWPCLMNYDGFNLFLCDPHVDLSALHSTQNMTELLRGASQRHFNGVLVEMETDPSLAPSSVLTLFPPSFFSSSSHSHSLSVSSTPTAGRTQL